MGAHQRLEMPPDFVHTDKLEADIPLFRQLVRESTVKIVTRGVDRKWYSSGYIPVGAGWNPLTERIYIEKNSPFSRYLAGENDLRKLNFNDDFMKQLLFVVHDYLHIWALKTLQREFGVFCDSKATLSHEELEKHVASLLLTEAVATEGLDYWFLNQVDLCRQIGIGSKIESLTVECNTRDLPEYRLYCPTFDSQRSDFFHDVASCYVDGEFPGFDIRAIERSPTVLKWLRHEVGYAAKQREYSRLWLSYLNSTVSSAPKEELRRPVACDKRWLEEACGRLSEKLWAKVKHDRHDADQEQANQSSQGNWKNPATGPIDFRFSNAWAFGDRLLSEIERRGVVPESNKFLHYQLISGIRFDSLQEQGRRKVMNLGKAGKTRELLRYFEEDEVMNKLGTPETAPDELFFLP